MFDLLILGTLLMMCRRILGVCSISLNKSRETEGLSYVVETTEAGILEARLCESLLSAHIIEDRSLTCKQYESVNGLQLFRIEVDSDPIPQLYRKLGPFFLCTTIPESTLL